jgi:hypothetical protein
LLLLIALPSASLVEASNIPLSGVGMGIKASGTYCPRTFYLLFGIGSRKACLGALTSLLPLFIPSRTHPLWKGVILIPGSSSHPDILRRGLSCIGSRKRRDWFMAGASFRA